MEIKGKLVKKLEVETGTSKAGKEWQKQNFVINTGDQFNPEVCIGLFGDKVDLLNGVNVGDELTVSINVSSREFNGKYYTQVDGWKIAKGSSIQQPVIEQYNNNDEPDDLPF
jgi:hypothetical protein